ncbi:XS domain-containing protein [Forsythia ovata]|uniref:XS domain-containing protein n=1 Tax=Forsythia ovata TaxID=205694 RepID=A0ABD1UDX0_9LAMI
MDEFMMANSNDGARIVKPWTVIVANLPVRIENNIRVDNCSINLERRWKRQGYLINTFQPLYDYRGHYGFALLQFARDLDGLKSAFQFDISFIQKRRGKAEWDEASEHTNDLFAWMASEEDYNKNDIVGYNLTNSKDLTSAPNIQMQEARHYRMVLYNLRESLHSIAQHIQSPTLVSRVQLLLQMLDKNEKKSASIKSGDKTETNIRSGKIRQLKIEKQTIEKDGGRNTGCYEVSNGLSLSPTRRSSRSVGRLSPGPSCDI